MKLKKRICLFFCVFLAVASLFAQDASAGFEEGEKLFRQNKPKEAIPLFEKALSVQPVNPLVYVYLGIAYYQTGSFSKSLDICMAGVALPGTNNRVLAFNAGNSAFALGDYAKAEECYSLASAADETNAAPVLNRSNAILKQGRIEDAVSSYEKFLAMAPDDEQSPKVHELINALKGELDRRAQEKVKQEQEAARMKEEAERIVAAKAEADRVAAEKAVADKAEADRHAAEEAAAAAERRRKLLEDVAASLQNTDTEKMSAGTEDVMEYDNESQLE